MTPFALRLAERVQRFGPLCIGIDPSSDALSRCDLPDSAEGALAFGTRILESARYALPIVKPQLAFFERFGSSGYRALEELIALGRRHEVLMLLDGKRGDIDSTAAAYADAFFAPGSPLGADAATLHAYLGIGALRPFFERAHAAGAGVFVVVRSSNPEGEALQHARLESGLTVAESLCAGITAHNTGLGSGCGPVGAVVGATCTDAGATVAALPNSYILAPGVGAQGATFDDVARRMGEARGRVLPNVSRAILREGGTSEAIGTAIAALCAAARTALGPD